MRVDDLRVDCFGVCLPPRLSDPQEATEADTSLVCLVVVAVGLFICLLVCLLVGLFVCSFVSFPIAFFFGFSVEKKVTQNVRIYQPLQ